MGMPRKLNDEQLKKLHKMWEEGYSRAELAARFQCSVSCVGYMLRDGEKRLNNLVSFTNRKYHFLVGEEYDKSRIFYHLNKAIEYAGSFRDRLSRRFPEYKGQFEEIFKLCSETIESIKPKVENHLVLDWEFFEKDTRRRWREFEKEHRAKAGKSIKNHLDR